MICTVFGCDRQIISENDIKRGLCFHHHIKGVQLGFLNGIDNWRGPTVREIQRSYEDTPDFKSGKISKISTRKELV